MKNVGNTTAEKSATLLSKNLEEKKKIRTEVRTTDRIEGILNESSDTEPETVEKDAKTQLWKGGFLKYGSRRTVG
jgi:hypothetical protein